MLWLLMMPLAQATTVRATVEIGPRGHRIVSAVTVEGEARSTEGPIQVLSADGEVVATAALPPLATHRAVSYPEGGGGVAELAHGLVRVEIPWPEGADRLRFGSDEARPRRGVPTSDAVALQFSGETDRRLDLVFFSEGYTSLEASAFAADTQRVVDYLATVSPWSEYLPLFNIWRVFLPSAESGVTGSADGVFADTHFQCAYNCEGIQRLICCDDDAVATTIDAFAPYADGVMILANSDVYGGSGGFVYSTAFTGEGTDSLRVALHELGHALIGLWDEYGYGIEGDATDAPNCAPEADAPPWDLWLDLPTVDAFPPCTYSNAVRPTLNRCLMNTLQDGYCPICEERIIEAVYGNSNGDILDGAVPAEGGTLIVKSGSTLSFDVSVAEPTTGLTWEWDVDGVLVHEGRDFTLDGCANVRGELTLTVRDDTERVRRTDWAHLMQDSISWTVRTDRCTGVCGCRSGPDHLPAPLVLLLPWLVRRRSHRRSGP